MYPQYDHEKINELKATKAIDFKPPFFENKVDLKSLIILDRCIVFILKI